MFQIFNLLSVARVGQQLMKTNAIRPLFFLLALQTAMFVFPGRLLQAQTVVGQPAEASAAPSLTPPPPVGGAAASVQPAVTSAEATSGQLAETAAGGGSRMPWWGWPLLLFMVTFLLGVIAVMAGVGGAVLFVPIVGGFFPFHLDFVRATGLLMALAGALAAGSRTLRSGMVNLRIGMPMSLIASVASIFGAMVGLAMPATVVNTLLGIAILLIATVMLLARKSEFPQVEKSDALALAFGMHGIYHDAGAARDVEWRTHRTPLALSLFFVIGFMAGMFGLGAGWANVPVLNLVMGAPLKVAVATSGFVISVTDTAAAWVYINHGAVLAMIAVPSLLGIMLGAMLGVRLLALVQASVIRKIVIVMLFISGARALLKGLGIWI